ncbi:MarR family transcriptional regulator [Mesobacterium sp. TK19101]|uniref:MarR family transcriptional regulator n=1 Tax=Mesobacterium hydrothermale TaxID=3111907 RepID=A0ABU6HG60_9RHOB|nr:MarR family transcriptional regulator [Mesobacterium sp. TK19101]MEC3861117.1 MarR family transcriptional regulator [Mesobacterium sp. TK19101]
MQQISRDPPMDQRDFDLTSFLPYRMAVASDRLSAGLAALYRRDFGISVPEWRVLVHLHHAGDVSVRDIEARVNMEKSKVSRAASRLESAGYLRKQAHSTDRRLLSLSLTSEGQALVARILPLAQSYERRVAERLGAHLDGLNAALDRLLDD